MLRGGPWPRETDFCFQCHRQDDYTAINPHQNADKKSFCAFCHETSKSEKGLIPTVDLQMAQQELCKKCHKDVQHEGQHLGSSVLDNRLKMNTAKALESFENSSGIVLPLGEGGTILCSTCHGPNPACGNPSNDKVEDGSKLLRAVKEQICYACHDL